MTVTTIVDAPMLGFAAALDWFAVEPLEKILLIALAVLWISWKITAWLLGE